jgi:hypothetical protein
MTTGTAAAQKHRSQKPRKAANASTTLKEEGGPIASPAPAPRTEQAVGNEDILTGNEGSGLDEKSERWAAVASTATATAPSLQQVLLFPTAESARIGGASNNRVVSPGDE